jgi:hypothetical protein
VANHVIFSLKLNTSKSNVHMKLMCCWNIHCWHLYYQLMTEIQLCFIRPCHGGCPILSSDKFIFSRTIVSYNIWKTMCYSCTYLTIITSEMIFIVFSANFVQAIFEKEDRSYAFNLSINLLFISRFININCRLPGSTHNAYIYISTL